MPLWARVAQDGAPIERHGKLRSLVGFATQVPHKTYVVTAPMEEVGAGVYGPTGSGMCQLRRSEKPEIGWVEA